MDEPFGPEYLSPAQRDCPRCECCTEELCEKGRVSERRCAGHSPAKFRDQVRGCPCSAATTKHTVAWQMAQVRVTRLALERPLPPEMEDFLRLLAAGRPMEAAGLPEATFERLRLRGLVQVVHGMPAITPLGHTYVWARDDVRGPAAVRVEGVDVKAGTATLEVPAWRHGETVRVLLRDIVEGSGTDAESLPGRWLVADANCQAPDADRLVLIGFGTPAPLPELAGGAQ